MSASAARGQSTKGQPAKRQPAKSQPASKNQSHIKDTFLLDEDYDSIIQKALAPRTIISTRLITTGWTNLVFEVKTSDGDFFCRFPRDEFWSKAIVKDYEFCKYLNHKLPCATSELVLHYDKDRPFSIHRKIEGEVLADVMAELTPAEADLVAADIAQFMQALHNLPSNLEDIFSHNQLPVPIGEFLDALMRYHYPEKPDQFFEDIYVHPETKSPSCIIHGDLNVRNIILGPDHHVVGVIDFAFGGIGAATDDLSRLASSSSENLVQPLIRAFNATVDHPADHDYIAQRAAAYHMIDLLYIDYLKSRNLF